jgi:glycosyltransferase involved in cell wall biosynthesis
MKVAFPKSGGLPIWELPVLNELRRIEVNAKFILPRKDERINQDSYEVARTFRGMPLINRVINGSLVSQLMNGLFNIRTTDLTSKFWNVKKIVRKYDIIHLVDDVMYPNKQFVELNKKCVMTVWENIPFNPMSILKKPTSTAWNSIKSKIDHYLPVSEDSAYLLRLNGISEERITKIHPGIDTNFFKKNIDEKLLNTINSENKFMLLGVGRLVYEKGITFTLRALRKLKDYGRNILYVHIGTGDNNFLKYLTRITELLGISENVKIIGSIPYSEMPKYYSMADSFILPSVPNFYWEEQLGYATLESMSCGTVPIVSDSTATREVVPDECGFRVPAGNVQQVCEVVEQIMDSPEESRKISHNGVIHVNNEYNARKTAKNYKKVYENIMSDSTKKVS